MGQRNLHLWDSSRAEQTGQKLDGFSFFSCARLDSERRSEFACSEPVCHGRTRDTYSTEAGKDGSCATMGRMALQRATRGPAKTSLILGGFRPARSMAKGKYKLGLLVASLL